MSYEAYIVNDPRDENSDDLIEFEEPEDLEEACDADFDSEADWNEAVRLAEDGPVYVTTHSDGDGGAYIRVHADREDAAAEFEEPDDEGDDE